MLRLDPAFAKGEQTLEKCLLLSSMKVTSGSCYRAAAAAAVLLAAALLARAFDEKQLRPTRDEGDVARREKRVHSI